MTVAGIANLIVYFYTFSDGLVSMFSLYIYIYICIYTVTLSIFM